MIESQAITHDAKGLHTLADLAAIHAAMFPAALDIEHQCDADSGQHILADFV